MHDSVTTNRARPQPGSPLQRELPQQAEVVICGAGIAGAACAYFLAHRAGVRDVIIVEAGAPLSLTSDKSTECYRNWWPGPGTEMVRFMNRSIDLLEELTGESADRFSMNRRGYLFATATPQTVEQFIAAGEQGEALGVGPLRQHRAPAHRYEPHQLTGIESTLDGCDLITDRAAIAHHFPYLAPETLAVLHVRRCGWLSAQQLGAYYLEKAREAGARIVQAEVEAVTSNAGQAEVRVVGANGPLTITTAAFVNAAGPHARAVGQMSGLDLPLECEGHVKMSFDDPLGAYGRDAPLLIWADPIELPWTDEERAALAADPSTARLLEPYPIGAHGRPTGGLDATSAILYWTYEAHVGEPVFPMQWDPHYPEIVLRGMSRMLPRLADYFERMPRPFIDGGYYTKTVENRPLIGPTEVPGIYLCNAFSGFGIMASAAAGELLAAHLTEAELPDYAGAFALSRYDDPAYQSLLANWPDSGQL